MTTGGDAMVVVEQQQCLAICVLVVVSLGWAWAARRRELYSSRDCDDDDDDEDDDDDVFDVFDGGRRRRRRQKQRLKSSSTSEEEGEEEHQHHHQQQPAVGVVLPVRGASGRTTDNWRTQLNTTHDGDVSFVFVVEKDTDEAKREAERLAALELRRDEEKNEKGRARRRSARVVVSGSAEGCSQKIAQQLRGVEELAAAAAAGKKRVWVGRDVEEDVTKNDERGVGSGSAEKHRRRPRRSRTNNKSPERNGRVKYVLFLDDDVMLYPSTIGSLVRAMEKDEEETGGNALLATGYPLDFVGGGVDGGDVESSSSCFANYMTMVYHLVLLIPFSHGKYTKNVWGGCMLFRLDDFQANACKVKEAYENGGYSDDLIVAAAANREKRSILCPGDALFPLPLDPKQTVGHFVNYFHRQIFVNDTYSDRHMKCINHGMLLAMFLSSLCLTCGTVSSAIDVALWLRSLATSSQKYTTRTPTLAFAVFFAHFLAMTRAKTMYASCVSICERTADAATQRTAAAASRVQTPPDAGRVARAGFNRTNWFKVWLALCVVYAAAPVLCAHVVFFSNDVTWGGIRYRKRHGKVTRVL